MNFQTMEYFIALARERSFTRAAEGLHITQQSLSAHIAGLEKEVGCPLLVRHVPLELTYAGEVFLEYAKTFQDAERALRRELGDISQNQRGVLRVGAASARGRAILPGAIADFQKMYPNIRVDLTEGANDVLCTRLQQGRLDLAIADFPEAPPKIRLRNFYREETVLLIQRNLFNEIYQVRAADCERQFRNGDFKALETCPLVMGGAEDIDGRVGLSVLKRAGIERPRIAATSHNVGMLLELCLEGVGACFCPEILTRGAITGELMAFQLPEEATYWIRFGCQADSYQWNVLKAFMDCAEKVVTKVLTNMM